MEGETAIHKVSKEWTPLIFFIVHNINNSFEK